MATPRSSDESIEPDRAARISGLSSGAGAESDGDSRSPDMPRAWHDCMEQLRDRIPAEDMRNWVTTLQPVIRGNTLKLLAPNRYVLEYVKANLHRLIEKIVLGSNSDIEVVQVEIGGHESSLDVNSPTTGAATAEARRAAPPLYASGGMNPEYIFDKHIEGNSNQLARAAALRVGASPGRSYNPLFIHGEVGLGKTHLMQAAGHLMRETDPSAKVIYVASELFVNQMVNALKNNEMPKFKRHYRSLGALLIDDIQFFAKKTQSQEEFFHTFNTLLDGQRQIIITSDRIPEAITDVDDRLVSRFGNGLTVGIEPPELETRVAILEKKALDLGVDLSNEVAFFVANAFCSNVRVLEGALHSIRARAEFTGRPIDLHLTREALRDRLAHQERQISVDNILKAVAKYYNLRKTDLLAKSRYRNIVRPRQLAMYLAKEYTNLSLPQIGSQFNGRDHTTVLHACRRIEALLQSDTGVKEDCQNLQRLIGV